MALTVDFSASQVIGEPSEIVLTDGSTGTDAAVTKRRVYLQTSQSTYLVEDGTTTDYEEWNNFPTTTSITLDVLDKDYALSITVQWLNSSNTVLYSKTELTRFTLYNEQFLYDLTSDQTATPSIIRDTNFYLYKLTMRELVDSGNQAVDLASDISGAQNMYDAATSMRLNQNLYF